MTFIRDLKLEERIMFLRKHGFIRKDKWMPTEHFKELDKNEQIHIISYLESSLEDEMQKRGMKYKTINRKKIDINYVNRLIKEVN